MNSLEVSWTPPATGSVTSYSVTVKEKGSDSIKETKPVSGTTATFTDLAAGTEYTVAVVSVAGVVSSGGQSSDSLGDDFFTSKSVMVCLFR